MLNGIRYKLTEEIEEGTIGNNVLVENVVDNDRSTFRITGSVSEIVTVEFDNGSKMILEIGDSTYEVKFVDGETPVVVDTDTGTCITSAPDADGNMDYEYNPLVAFTGYTAESSTIYTKPQTRLTASNGTSLEFMYDMTEGVKKAVITYPSTYQYYSNDDLPSKSVKYNRGDINFDGIIDNNDRILLDNYLNSGGVL